MINKAAVLYFLILIVTISAYPQEKKYVDGELILQL